MSDKNSSGGFVANLMIFGGFVQMCGCADVQDYSMNRHPSHISHPFPNT
jgi:hypothetical protein